MSQKLLARRIAVAAACVCAGIPSYALAADAASTAASVVVITGQKEGRTAAAMAPVPATVESVSALQIEENINTVTTAGALQYLPSVHVRERYIGDRNGILVMRVNSSIASAQTTVYADGLLLSNFLNNSFSTAPRWGMVSPEEIDRIDTIYGPFSALYPGNSAGGVVRMTTRMPTRLEAHARVDAFGQRFQLYGTNEDFNGHHASASVGNALGDFAFWVSLDRLDNEGHPQTFGNTTTKTGAPATAGTFTDVSGSPVIRDIDTSGNPRIIVSSTGIDHTVQDMAKLKLAWRPATGLQASYTLGLWRNQSVGSVDSYLRDTAGRTVFNASATMTDPFKFVRIDGRDYTVSAAAPSRSESEHWMHGLSLKLSSGPWEGELVASVYDQKKDLSRNATPRNGYDDGLGATRPGGQLTDAAGTGWQNLDLRGQWRSGGSLASSAHTLSFGLHQDHYELASVTSGTADWLTSDTGTLNTNSYGQTRTQALYLQDSWRISADWLLVAGGRYENWKAYGGSNNSASYPGREQSDFSPKLHVAWQLAPDWSARASIGKGVRYPTVSEMFQVFNGPNNTRVNDPNLKPESMVSQEWVLQQSLDNGNWRASVFFEDKRDALISQTDTTINLSTIQNVEQVKTHGVELAWQLADLGQRGFDLGGSVTWTQSTIERNSRLPVLEGSVQPRIPEWRATLVGTWHASDALSLSLAWRYSGRQRNQLLNIRTGQYNDVNPDVYGAVSSYSVFDTKLLYRINRQWSASLGINNLGNYKYYVNPNPYAQRTWFAGLKYDL